MAVMGSAELNRKQPFLMQILYRNYFVVQEKV